MTSDRQASGLGRRLRHLLLPRHDLIGQLSTLLTCNMKNVGSCKKNITNTMFLATAFGMYCLRLYESRFLLFVLC